jgi:hypothetical protein
MKTYGLTSITCGVEEMPLPEQSKKDRFMTLQLLHVVQKKCLCLILEGPSHGSITMWRKPATEIYVYVSLNLAYVYVYVPLPSLYK